MKNFMQINMIVISIVLSGFIMFFSKLYLIYDPALHLAQQLGLGNGIILGGVLGGLTGLYLSIGGQERLTRFGGMIIGIAVGVLFYQWGKPHAWIIEAVLVGAFGENGGLYTGLASVMLLFFAIRLTADLGKSGLTRLLEWTDAREQHKQLVREAVAAAGNEAEKPRAA